MKQEKTKLFFFFLLIFVLLNGCKATNLNINGEVIDATVYKSPDCGCCVGHAEFMTGAGINVDIIPTTNMDAIKEKYNIPSAMQSCHTAVIGDYFVEGHVPLEAIERLLTEKPDVDGIALPRMPAGSPGMPGVKDGPWKIYSLKDGVPSEWMVL